MATTDLYAQMLLRGVNSGDSARPSVSRQLLANALDGKPVYSAGAALAKALTGGLAGYMAGRERDDARVEQKNAMGQLLDREAQQQAAASDWSRAVMGGQGGGFSPPPPAPEPPMPAAPAAPGPVMTEPLPPPAGVPQRGEAPPAVSQGIAQRAALDPNSPTYAQDIMRINDGVIGQTMPGQRMPQPAPTAPAGQQMPPNAVPPQLGGMPRIDPQVVLAGLNSPNPTIRQQAQALMPIVQAQMQQANRAPLSVAPGTTLLDPATRQPIYTAPDRPSETDRQLARWRELTARGEQATPAEVQERDILGRRLQGSGTNVTVNGERSFADRLSGKAADRVDDLSTRAGQATDAIRSADRIADLLDGGAITGTGAEFRLSVERALRTAGLIDGRRVANTEQLMTELARGTLEAAGGLSGPTSDRDILFLREVAGGSIALTPETLRRVTAVARAQAERTITRYNEAAEIVARDERLPPAVRELYRPRSFPTREQQPAPANPAPARPPISTFQR